SIFQSGVNLGSNQGNFGIQGTAADGTPIGQAQITGSDAVTIQPVLLCDPRSNLGENQYINGSCFGAPSPGKNGMFQFPYLRGPSFMNHALSLFKSFQVSRNENHKLQLRLSGYNILNHPLNTFVDGDPTLILAFDNGKPKYSYAGTTYTKHGRPIVQFADISLF